MIRVRSRLTTSATRDIFRIDSSGEISSQGEIGIGNTSFTGGGVRLIWFPFRAAFRTGQADSTQNDFENIGFYSVAGGLNNVASGFGSVAFGQSNTSSGATAFASGTNNTATGNDDAVFGRRSFADGSQAFAAGFRAGACGNGTIALGSNVTTDPDGTTTTLCTDSAATYHHGSMVLGDGANAALLKPAADDQFTARFSNGYRLFSNSAMTAGVVVTAGGGSWSNLSDRNMKENFTPVDGEELLQRLRGVPITTWNYKSQDLAIRHIGPMAQDFRAAFGLGEDDRHIATIDPDGVALAGVQALDTRTAELREEVEALHRANAELQTRIERLEELLRVK
jgi:hypothetical protein